MTAKGTVMPERIHNAIHIIQGQFHVSDRPDDVLSTVLGSCVAACLHDPLRRIGGMNHFLLPGNDPNAGNNVKYGAHSMEQLINAMLRAGAGRDRLEAHIFGGGNVVAGLGRFGDMNAAFAREFVRQEGFALRTVDTGGLVGRRLRFQPASGAAWVVRLDPADTALTRGETVPPNPPAASCSVELF